MTRVWGSWWNGFVALADGDKARAMALVHGGVVSMSVYGLAELTLASLLGVGALSIGIALVLGVWASTWLELRARACERERQAADR